MRRRARLACALLVVGTLAGAAFAQDLTRLPSSSLPAGLRDGGPRARPGQTGNPMNGMPMRARVSPAPARLGEPLRYQGMLLVGHTVQVRFEPPRNSGALSWSAIRAGREKRGWVRNVSAYYDSVWFEARLQVFATGPVAIPGPVVQLSELPGQLVAGRTRLPTVRLMVLPTITDADSDADLRALHGPLAAPWWERLPWLPILLALLLLLALVLVVRALRRRKPKRVVRPVTAPAVARPRLDPAAEAIRALAALRARALPAAGRFGEHAQELTAILRRFLEATVTTPRPGDTSGEVLERLREARLPEPDLDRLGGLLGLWDRVKFAREPLTETEAARCEDAVETYVRSVAQARLEAEQAARAAAARAAAAAGRPASGGPPPEAA